MIFCTYTQGVALGYVVPAFQAEKNRSIPGYCNPIIIFVTIFDLVKIHDSMGINHPKVSLE